MSTLLNRDAMIKIGELIILTSAWNLTLLRIRDSLNLCPILLRTSFFKRWKKNKESAILDIIFTNKKKELRFTAIMRLNDHVIFETVIFRNWETEKNQTGILNFRRIDFDKFLGKIGRSNALKIWRRKVSRKYGKSYEIKYWRNNLEQL